jgi:hypothetical protein
MNQARVSRKRGAPEDALSFNREFSGIFEKHNIPLGEKKLWLVRNRSIRNITKTYAMGLDYCTEVIGNSKNQLVLENACLKGDLLVEEVNELLKIREMGSGKNCDILRGAKERYLKARVKKDSVIAERGREFTVVHGDDAA